MDERSLAAFRFGLLSRGRLPRQLPEWTPHETDILRRYTNKKLSTLSLSKYMTTKSIETLCRCGTSVKSIHIYVIRMSRARGSEMSG